MTDTVKSKDDFELENRMEKAMEILVEMGNSMILKDYEKILNLADDLMVEIDILTLVRIFFVKFKTDDCINNFDKFRDANIATIRKLNGFKT